MNITHLLALLTFFISLSFSEQKVFYLMGTYAILDLPDGKDYEAYKYMRGLEERLSDYIEESEVSKINRYAGSKPAHVSQETLEVVKKALYVSQMTDGAFDITVGALTIRAKRLKEIPEDQAKKLIDYRKVKILDDKVFLEEKGMAIDLGGIGKGYAVQKAYEYIKTPWGFISIAGDMKVWGQKRLIGIYNPATGGVLMEGINKKDLCLSTSGNYFREHIVGKTNNLLQVSVVHTDCTLADALSTAIFAMDDRKREEFLRRHQDVGVLLLFKDGSLYYNREFFDNFEVIVFKN